MNPRRLYDVAAAALAAVANYYDEQGDDLDLPARRAVVPSSSVAWDCELCAVTVTAVGAHDGDPSQQLTPILEADPAYFLRFALLTVTILRNLPVSADAEPPSVDDEDQVARQVLADQGMVWLALVAAQDAGDLPCCGGIAFVGWTQVVAEGGLGGSVTTVQVSLE